MISNCSINGFIYISIRCKVVPCFYNIYIVYRPVVNYVWKYFFIDKPLQIFIAIIVFKCCCEHLERFERNLERGVQLKNVAPLKQEHRLVIPHLEGLEKKKDNRTVGKKNFTTPLSKMVVQNCLDFIKK